MPRIWLILLVVLFSVGCQSNPDKADAVGEQDLIELKKKAEEAYSKKDYAKAKGYYEQLSKSLPKDALTWFRLGNIHARLRQPNQAIAAYEKAVVLDPTLSKAWHNMGLLQLRQSANSFTQMAQRVRSGDPLHPRAIKLSQGTLKLLEN